MSAEVIDLNGYRMARQIERAAMLDDEYGGLIEAVAETYRQKARTVLQGDGGERLQPLATPLPRGHEVASGKV